MLCKQYKHQIGKKRISYRTINDIYFLLLCNKYSYAESLKYIFLLHQTPFDVLAINCVACASWFPCVFCVPWECGWCTSSKINTPVGAVWESKVRSGIWCLHAKWVVWECVSKYVNNDAGVAAIVYIYVKSSISAALFNYGSYTIIQQCYSEGKSFASISTQWMLW